MTTKTTRRTLRKTTRRKEAENQIVSIELRNLTSELIRDISYTNGDLTVTLRTGALYRYPKVSNELVQEFLAAESYGSYFNETIRHLPFERLA